MVLNQRLRLACLILAIAGFIDACYLIWIKISQNRALCFINAGDCFSVNNSKYSEILGIPVSVLGALTYLAIFLIFLLDTRNVFFRENGSLFVFGLALVGVMYSAYLTYVEIAVLRTICPFCVISAIIILLIFVLSIVRLTRSQAA
jgi:uncharacterized membrane protein